MANNMPVTYICPIFYDGVQVEQFTVESMYVQRECNGDRCQGRGPRLRFLTKDGVSAAASVSFNDTPYTLYVQSSRNGAVSNTANDWYVLAIKGGLVTDGAGTVTREWGTETTGLTSEPLRFDFVPPSLDGAQIEIGGEPVVANRMYSAASGNRFGLRGVSDHGVGVDSTGIRIDVGNCPDKLVDVGGESVDRSIDEWQPLFRNVRSIGDLPEDDAIRSRYTDRGGVDCYVAALGAVADRLGNTINNWRTAEDRLQTAPFGVDKTPPDLSNVRLDGRDRVRNVGDIRIRFNAVDPALESGDVGTGVSAEASSVRVPGLGSVGPVRISAGGSGLGSLNLLPSAGEWTLVVEVADHAVPPNRSRSRTALKVSYDGTPPTVQDTVARWMFRSSRNYIDLSVTNRVSDDTAIRKTTVSVRNITGENASCSLDAPDIGRWSHLRRTVRDSTETAFTFTDSLRIQSIGISTMENLCVLFSARDDFGNRMTAPLQYIQVRWRWND